MRHENAVVPDVADVAFREREALAAHRRGWRLTPLDGKRPTLKGWQRAPRPTEEQVRGWARAGNLGLRTGAVSGVVVVDVDPRNGGSLEALERLAPVPATPTVETGGGGWHLYFRLPPGGLGSSKDRLAPGVDVQADGRQVVFVGSVHPETGRVYRWQEGRSPEEVSLADLPAAWLARLGERPTGGGVRAPRHGKHAPPGDPSPRREAWARAALERETEAVSRAVKGTRNDTLNRAAFNLGQLVAGRLLNRNEVEDALLGAAHACGLVADDGEAPVRATIRSGLQAGARDPRTGPPTAGTASADRATRSASSRSDAVRVEVGGKPEVLVRGSHMTADGKYLEVGNGRFAATVLDALPDGLLYRRGEEVGELVGPPGNRSFSSLLPDRLRALVDEHVRLVGWKTRKREGETRHEKVYRPCTRDMAHVILANARAHPRVRDLRFLTRCPVFVGRDLVLSAPGWNPEHGVFYDEPEDLRGVGPEEDPVKACEVLEDLVVDFPWKTPADRETFFGLLLTPLLRPALDGNVPMFLILSPLERTGKSKLAEQVVGGVILGHPTPAMQLSGTDEERDKRILALLLEGTPVVHIDNVREYLDSAALASLLTARTYSGRLLGRSKIVRLPNTVTLVATGNNVRATGEIVKRTVPLRLQPRTDSPETRTDFEHPDLPGFVREVRRQVVAALLGLVVRWVNRGRPPGRRPMGGFEEWARVVGGIMQEAGYEGFLSHVPDWKRSADPQGADLRTLVELWHQRFGGAEVRTRDLLWLAEENELFGPVLKGRNEKARQTALAMRVLRRYVDAPVGRWIIRARKTNARVFYLEPNEEEGT